MTEIQLKDARLAALSERANIAQFISFSPGSKPSLRYTRIRGVENSRAFMSPREAVEVLISCAPTEKVCIRSFIPGGLKDQPFHYGVSSASEASALMDQLAEQGFYVIANEMIDVMDGGVAGVCHGRVLEFSPLDTPRCVGLPGTAALPTDIGLNLLEIVYRTNVELRHGSSRVEFGYHPIRVGYRHSHTVIWEIEDGVPTPIQHRRIEWPNRFSEFIGDKTYGLLLAHCFGLPVPRTLAITRGIAPFSFGEQTGSGETWFRTAPANKAPGQFPTYRGWKDPFAELSKLGDTACDIKAVLAQEAVESQWSGALVTQRDGHPVIEGIRGCGDQFMIGAKAAEALPAYIRSDVLCAYEQLGSALGDLRMEWAHDGQRVWVMQLNVGRSSGLGNVIVDGNPAGWLEYDVGLGLPKLPAMIQRALDANYGIILLGDVGVTSHFAELLQTANVPARIQKAKDE